MTKIYDVHRLLYRAKSSNESTNHNVRNIFAMRERSTLMVGTGKFQNKFIERILECFFSIAFYLKLITDLKWLK